MVQPQPAGGLAVIVLVLFGVALLAGARVASHRDAPKRRPAMLHWHRRVAAAAIGLALVHGVAALVVDRQAPIAGILIGVAALLAAAVAAFAWRLRRRLPRAVWANAHRAGYAVVPLGVTHAWIVHPGPMAPVVEPLLYSLAIVVVCAVVLGRVANERAARGRLA